MRVMDLLQAPQATHLQGDHFIHIQSQFPRLLLFWGGWMHDTLIVAGSCSTYYTLAR